MYLKCNLYVLSKARKPEQVGKVAKIIVVYLNNVKSQELSLFSQHLCILAKKHGIHTFPLPSHISLISASKSHVILD